MARRPHVLLSVAMSADGYIDDASVHRLILSDEADLDRVDELRAGADAIMVGAGTIRSDNPRLAVRSPARRQGRLDAGLPPSPVKVTLTTSGELDPKARFFADAQSRSLLYAPAVAAAALRVRLPATATVVGAPVAAVPSQPAPPTGPAAAAKAGLDLAWILADLADRGVRLVMVEGGAMLLWQFLAAGLADELRLAIAPVFVADEAAPRLVAGPVPARLRLAGVSQAGDMAVLRYLPAT